MIGLPTGSMLAIGVMILVPILTYLLYRVDTDRGDGHVTVVGKR